MVALRARISLVDTICRSRRTKHKLHFILTFNFLFIQSIVRQRIATKTVQFKREKEEAKMFIQANLKHAYTFNSIRGAEDLFEQFEEDNIIDVSTKNVNDIVIEAVKKNQRAYRTYRTKCSILLKKHRSIE